MNIIVKPRGSDLCYCRPDTTWERENKDFYVPEGVESLYWTPILFARISKAGKCINPKFASRYYDAFNFGILLYTGKGEIAFTSCADHTSILPAPLYSTVVMEGKDNRYLVVKDSEEIFSALADMTLVEDAICRASERTSVRIGDFVAVELDEKRMLAERKDTKIRVKVSFGENETCSFKVIF